MAEGSTTPTLGVVICTHSEERHPLLRGLIASIAAGERVPDSIVVVVDRNPALLERLRTDAWPVPVQLMASVGGGLASARNTGWRALATDLVAFIDDDATASPAWLRELGSAMDEFAADVIGGRIDAEWVGGTPSWYTDRLGWVVGCSYTGQPVTPQVVRNVIGCNMLMRRSVLDATAGFDAALGRVSGGLAGCEETELCIRAAVMGARVVLVPGASVSQVLPTERGRARYALRRAWDEGRSKRLLTQLHGSVLGTESSYAADLVRDALKRIASGVVHRRALELERGGVMLSVLAAASAAYVAQAARGLLFSLRPARNPADTRAAS
jgi:GT2 family glycosyltransferase